MNPKFNLADWKSRFAESDYLLDEESGVVRLNSIVGPHDVCKIAYCRELMEDQINWGEAEYIDYFIWAQGEGSVVGATRMGGRPDLPGIDHWPRGARGEFLPFIGQINFSDSRDLVNVPENLVLIFAHLVNGCVEEYKLLWLDPGNVSRLEPESMPATAFEIIPHHAYVCRLEVFRHASPMVAPEDHYVRMLGKKLYHFGDLSRPRGTCIGGYDRGEKYLAIINCLTPTPRVIYPYINRQEPYPFEEWITDASARMDLARDHPLITCQLPNGESLLCIQEYPSTLFEFSDCGSLLIAPTADGGFELQTTSF